MSRILITGAGGLLGQRVAPLCRRHFGSADVFMVYHHSLDYEPQRSANVAVGDLTDIRFITELIAHCRPDVIVNLAALTNVEACETSAALAQRVNVGIVEKLIELAPEAKVVQLSTDYVFDGAKGSYTPEDTPAPISLYGQTKYDAERVVTQNPRNLVVRTSGTYDWRGRDNLFTFFYNRLKADRETLALTGSYYTPIWANDLAKGLLGLLATDATGITHYAGVERMTRYDFALAIARHFNFDAGLICPVMQEKFNWKARRPVDSSLDSSGGYESSDVRPHSLDASLQLFGEQGGASPSTTVEA